MTPEPQDPAAAWRTPTCTCGRARRPDRAASAADRDSRGAPGARSSTIDACSRATCDSSAMVTRSRKRRCTRVLTVRRNQVAAADSAEADRRGLHERSASRSSTPVAEQLQPERQQRVGQRGELRRARTRRPSGAARGGSRACTAATSTTAPAAAARSLGVRRGRHSVMPSSSSAAAETLRLQIEHRAIAPAERHQLVVRAELDDPAVLEHADAIGMAHGREAMRDEDGRAVARRGEQAIEDLRLAAHVELRGRLVEQDDAGAQPDRARARGRARRAATGRPTDRCRRRSRARGRCRARRGRRRRPPPARARRRRPARPPGATLSRSGSSKRMKSWNTAVTRDRHDSRSRSRRSTPSTSMAPACGSYSRHSSFAIVVLPAPFCPTMASDEPAGMVRSKPSSTGASRARVGERDVAEADLARGQRRRRGRVPGGQRAGRRHRGLEPQHRGDRRRRAVERPAESAERDHRHADRGLRRRRRPRRGRGGPRPRRRPATRTRATFAATTSSTLHSTGRSRSRVASYCSSCSACGARRSGRASSRRGRTAAAPCSPADRRRAGTRSRRRAARARTSSVLRSCQIALSRSSQCVASQAPASTSGAHHA